MLTNEEKQAILTAPDLMINFNENEVGLINFNENEVGIYREYSRILVDFTRPGKR